MKDGLRIFVTLMVNIIWLNSFLYQVYGRGGSRNKLHERWKKSSAHDNRVDSHVIRGRVMRVICNFHIR